MQQQQHPSSWKGSEYIPAAKSLTWDILPAPSPHLLPLNLWKKHQVLLRRTFVFLMAHNHFSSRQAGNQDRLRNGCPYEQTKRKKKNPSTVHLEQIPSIPTPPHPETHLCNSLMTAGSEVRWEVRARVRGVCKWNVEKNTIGVIDVGRAKDKQTNKGNSVSLGRTEFIPVTC